MIGLRTGILGLALASSLLFALPASAHRHVGNGQTGQTGYSPAPAPRPVPNTGSGASGGYGEAIPPCMSGNQALPIDNEQVIQWKTSTPNQFLARAHVQGPITRTYPDHSGHTHFEIEIGSGAQGTLEIIYNQSFGALPALQVGMQIEACGDYITSISQSGAYPPSPDGAILHWVHRNPGGGHASGYVAVNGVLYGQGNGNGSFH